MSDEKTTLAQLEDRLDLVRDQVDELQVRAAEPRRRWYRQTPSLPSLLALLLSIATAVYSSYERRQQDVHGKKEELRRLTSSLIDLRIDYQNKVGSAEFATLAPATREFLSGMINRKRMIYMEDADNLVRQISTHVPSATYDFLSGEKAADGSAKAVDYLQKAVEVSQEKFSRVIAVRNLGILYSQRGPFYNLAKARQQFAEAVSLTGETTDDEALLYNLGYTWEMWGMAEAGNGFPEAAQEKLSKARALYEKLSPWNQVRQNAIAFLETREQLTRGTNGPGMNAPLPFSSPPAVPAPPVPIP